MSFTFTNAISPELAKNPLSNLVGNILSGYTGVTQARYLRPQLEEELKKAKLYNQYYGPNIESEIGLRGAQAGHLGSLTAGQNIANRFAPGRLQSEQQEREFKLNNPFFGQTGISGDVGRMLYLKQMLQNNPDLLQGIGGMGGLGGQQGQPNQMPQQASNGGEGQSYLPPIMQQANEPMHNQPSTMDMINQAIKNSLTPKSKYGPTPLEKAQSYAKSQEDLYGKDSEQAKIAHDYANKLAYGTPKKEGGKLTEHQMALEAAANFDKAPSSTKQLLIAQAAGMGISPSEAIKSFREKGKGIEDLAKERGFDPENLPDPIYPNSAKDISLIKQRSGALKEMKSIGKDVTEWAGDYAGKIMGFSPQQIKDAIQNKDPDKQAKLLAARQLSQDLNYLRLMVANGKATVHAIKALEETSLTKMKIFEPFVTPNVWKKMQEYTHESLERGLGKSLEAYSVQAKKNNISKALGKEEDNDPLGIR